MAYNYSSLSADERQAVIEQRIKQYELEIFNQELNLTGVETLPDSDPSKEIAIKEIKGKIGTLVLVIHELKGLSNGDGP